MPCLGGFQLQLVELSVYVLHMMLVGGMRQNQSHEQKPTVTLASYRPLGKMKKPG